MGNKKDINLLPEELRYSSSRFAGKRKNDNAVKEVSDSVKGLMDIITSKVSSIQYEKSKRMVSDLSKGFKSNLVGSLQQESSKPSGFFHSLKKVKLRNLEQILNVSKKDLIVSSKANYVYCTDLGKVIVVDKGPDGIPKTVTIKTSDSVTIKSVKFNNDNPFLYPKFNENDLPKDIIYMDEEEIWYIGDNEAILLLFKNDNLEYLKINLNEVKLNRNSKALLNYLECYKILHQDKRLSNLLLEERKITLDNIIRLRPHYALYKENNKSYRVLLFDKAKNISNEFSIQELPNVNAEAWDVLFSNEIYEYVKSNGYSFDNFRQANDHIEYWQNIGSNKVCVLRCKI
jgi:hypothetical protein